MKKEPMATITWTQVQQCCKSNPFNTKSLPSFVFSKESIQGPTEQVDADGWGKQPVFPATPLSAILFYQDILYQGSPEMARKSLLRDETTDLQEKAILSLKGRAWPVRKTAEGISVCGTEENHPSSWTSLGWNAICTLRECQIVILDEDKKQIQFYPEDIRNWRSDWNIFCVDRECRHIWTHANPKKILGIWLSQKESQGWTIQWPIQTGNMEELKAAFAKTNESATGKMNKDQLQKRIGRAQSIQCLHEWSSQ
jgi:hypothetical protein